MATFDVAAARAEMPSVQTCAFLNTGSFGPLPRVAVTAMRTHMAASLMLGRRGIEEWFVLHERARSAFARTFSAHEDTIALMHGASDGINTVISGLSFEDGDEIVTTTAEHPGVTAPLDELARRQRVIVRAVEPTLAAIAGAMTTRTRLIVISHVLWTNGEILPVADIAATARSYGAMVLVDGAQSLGAIEFDTEKLGVDFYAASGQKWLCGPSGTGALWIRPTALAQLRTPWPWYLSKSRDATGVRDWPTARRLDVPTVSMTSLAGLIASLAWHRTQIENGALAWAATLAQSLRVRLEAHPLVRLAPTLAPSTIVSFAVDRQDAGQLARRLERAGVCVRNVPDNRVRVSVGFWNDEADLEALVRGLE